MAKQYRQLESGLAVPDWMPDMRERRRIGSPKAFIFTPGGGCAGAGCHCAVNESCYDVVTNDVEEVAVNIPSGWSNDDCNNCSSVAGDYILTLGGTQCSGDKNANKCQWSFAQFNFCAGVPCPGSSQSPFPYYFLVVVDIQRVVPQPTNPAWRFNGFVMIGNSCGPPCEKLIYANFYSATYQSATYQKVSDAFADLGEIELALDSDQYSQFPSYPPLPHPCVKGMSDPMTIQLAT